MNFSVACEVNADHLLKYVVEVTEVLAKYSWIYNVRNTNFLVENVLEKIPREWNEALVRLNWEELKLIPFDFLKEYWPDSLKAFIKHCYSLGEIRFSEQKYEPAVKSDWLIGKKTPFKKQDEVKILSSLINDVCQIAKCDTVLDIGFGLGYLDETLHHNFGLHCIGLDSCPHNTNIALQRLKDDLCSPAYHYATLTVENTSDCVKQIRNIINDASNKGLKCSCQMVETGKESKSTFSSIIMTGLHCCGSLFQDMMKLFCNMTELKAFVSVGCCYNKIKLNEFPMSLAAKNCVSQICVQYPNWSPCISGLRLGSQRTRSCLPKLTSEQLEHRVKNMFFRAVLECYFKKEKVHWPKQKRRIKISNDASFEDYCRGYLADKVKGENEFRQKKLNDMYLKLEHLYPQTRILLILQFVLQPLWEAFVIVDRLLYFKERSISAEIRTLWNDVESPRNLALCAYKS